MKKVNAEHQEVLILLKHKAFSPTEKQAHSEPPAAKSKFTDNISAVFSLTNQQKQELASQSKNIINTLIDAVLMNNLKK